MIDGSLARELLDFFLPAACLGCGDHLSLGGASLVCAGCRTRLKEPAWPRCHRCGFAIGSGSEPGPRCFECADWGAELMGARSAVVLRPPADELVHGLKYGGWTGLAELMGRRMVRTAIPPDLTVGPYVIVPVPTTKRRLRSRGYNQAELLARTVSDGVDQPVREALERRRGGPTQVGLHPAQRRANVRNAFVAREEAVAGLSGVRVLLVDDVLTTGATAEAAARALVQAGATEVFLSTFARACPFV